MSRCKHLISETAHLRFHGIADALNRWNIVSRKSTCSDAHRRPPDASIDQYRLLCSFVPQLLYFLPACPAELRWCICDARRSERPILGHCFAQENSLAASPAHLRIDRRLQLNRLRLAFGMCLVLLLLMAVAHATIGHPAVGDADHCSLCVAAHSLVPIGLLAVAEVLIRFQTHAPEIMEERAVFRYWHPALFTRPPPAFS